MVFSRWFYYQGLGWLYSSFFSVKQKSKSVPHKKPPLSFLKGGGFTTTNLL